MTTHQLFCGDVREIQPTLPTNSVHLIITSPPYNVGVDYGKYKDQLPLKEYLSFLDNVFTDCIRILAPGGHMAIQVGNTGRQPYTPLSDFISTMLYDKITMRGEIIWYKQNMTSITAWGSWLSANMPSLRDCYEYILIFRKDGDRKGKSTITKDEWMEYTNSTWRINPEVNREHPAPYPEELVKRLIKLYSFLGETIYDPFIGSGTTSYMAKKLGRNSIGVDVNPEYIEMAKKRLARLDGSIEQEVKPIMVSSVL